MQTTSTTALVDLVGVMLRADADGAVSQALDHQGITDSYNRALVEALKAVGAAGIAAIEHRYSTKIPAGLLAQVVIAPDCGVAAATAAAPSDADLAKWLEVCHGVDLDTMPATSKASWIERYIELHNGIGEQLVRLQIAVRTEACATPSEVSATVQRLIEVGLEDAQATVSSGEGDLDAAQLATRLTVGDPSIMTAPRVLVVVQGGYAKLVQDEGADVVVFNWDNYDAAPGAVDGVPARFADLARQRRVPVAS